MRFAISCTLIHGSHQRNQAVADDEEKEEDDAVPDEHVEEGESKAQELQGLGVFAEWYLSFLGLLVAAVADFLRVLIKKAHPRSLGMHLCLFPVRLVLTRVKHYLNDIDG